MTEKAQRHTHFDFDLPDPSARVLALHPHAHDTTYHLVLPDAREETLCRRAVPPRADISNELAGPPCTECRSVSNWLGLTCASCGLPLLAEYDPGFCFACSCRRRKH